MAADIKKIVANAAVNSELESKKIEEDTMKMIESCLKTENGSFLFELYLKTKNNNSKVEDDIVTECLSSKYCYDNGVLKNSYGIKSLELLHIVESDSAAYYQSQIVNGNSNYKFSFDINSYLNLHRKLFSSIYPFAGEIRDEFIYKSCKPYMDAKTPFCMPVFIYDNLVSILSEMKKNISNINNRKSLVEYLGYYYGELNMIHPFREGNGRTLRTYFLLLVKELNKYINFGEFELDYSLWNEDDKKELVKSTIINSINGNTDGICKCFDTVLVQKIKKVRTRRRD